MSDSHPGEDEEPAVIAFDEMPKGAQGEVIDAIINVTMKTLKRVAPPNASMSMPIEAMTTALCEFTRALAFTHGFPEKGALILAECSKIIAKEAQDIAGDYLKTLEKK